MLYVNKKNSWQVTLSWYNKSNLINYKKGGYNLIKTNELKAIIIKNGYTQKQVAERIGITPKTFYEKMKKGVFGSDEIQIMIEMLNIENPNEIFFAKE